eukprot:scaffold283122_cov42-Prasinocladus_malaysianus.AAC.3
MTSAHGAHLQLRGPAGVGRDPGRVHVIYRKLHVRGGRVPAEVPEGGRARKQRQSHIHFRQIQLQLPDHCQIWRRLKRNMAYVVDNPHEFDKVAEVQSKASCLFVARSSQL